MAEIRDITQPTGSSTIDERPLVYDDFIFFDEQDVAINSVTWTEIPFPKRNNFYVQIFNDGSGSLEVSLDGINVKARVKPAGKIEIFYFTIDKIYLKGTTDAWHIIAV